MLLALAGLLLTPQAAQAQTEVPADWPLIPENLGAGDAFRLLFVTSTSAYDATSSNIVDYDADVQTAAAGGDEAIGTHGMDFKVFGSTDLVNALTHNDMSGIGVPIYWLAGDIVAEDYGELCDGTAWSSRSPRTESGETVNSGQVWTGTAADCSTDTYALGQGFVRRGDALTSRPLADAAVSNSASYRLYGLSPVFAVAAAEGDLPVITIEPREDRVVERPYAEVQFIVTRTGGDLGQVSTLVSNLDQGEDIYFGSPAVSGQPFTTGSHPAGYNLHSVVIASEDLDGDSFAASVCTVGTDNFPTSSCTALTVPASFAAGELEFTAPANTTLGAKTTYAVVIDPDGDDSVRLDATESEAQDSGAAKGWNIANDFAIKGWFKARLGYVLRIAVKGSALPGPSVSSVAFTSVPADAAYAIGDTIEVTVTFDEAVTVDTTNGTPNLRVQINSRGQRYPAYISGSGSTRLVFRYTVEDGDNDPDGMWIKPDVVDANGGTITSTAKGTAANLDHGGVYPNPALYVDGVRPALESAETSPDGGEVILTFDEPMGSGAGVFEVAYGGNTHEVNAESIVGDTVRLLLPVAVEADQTVTVSAPANAVQDSAGNGNEAIDSQAVTNRVVVIESVAITSDPGTEGIYAIGDAIKATVTFSQAVTVDTTQGTPTLELDVGGTARTASYVSGESAGAAVVFSYTVVENDEDGDGIAIGADSLALGGGTITAAGDPVPLGHGALPAAAGHRVDGVPPAPTGAATNADGTKVIVTFSEDLSTEDPVSHQYYQVGPPGQHPAVSASVANGNTVELTLNAITPISFTEDNLQVVYFGGSFAGAVRDVAGNAAASVSSVAVTNNVTEPAAYVTGVEITSDPGPDGIYATGEAIEVTATFSNAVTVETSGGTPRLRINMGLRLEPDRRWAGYDRGTDSTGLVFAYTVVASDESHERGVGWLRNGLELDGGTIGKTGTDEDAVLDHPSESGEPGHLVNWARPMLAGAETSRDGTRVILTYDEDLRSSGNPTNRLSVAVDGVAVALDGRAAVSGRTVTIPLASAVTATQTVTVTYTDAAGDQNTAGVIEDLVRNDAPSFTAKPVANNVGAAETLSGLEVWEMWTSSVSVRNRMTLSPGFASDRDSYTGTVRGETQYIEIRTGTTDDAATVSITPGDRFTGLPRHQVELVLGENPITITVTATDGVTKDYALTVSRGVPKVSSVAFTSDPDETGADDDTYVPATRSR